MFFQSRAHVLYPLTKYTTAAITYRSYSGFEQLLCSDRYERELLASQTQKFVSAMVLSILEVCKRNVGYSPTNIRE